MRNRNQQQFVSTGTMAAIYFKSRRSVQLYVKDAQLKPDAILVEESGRRVPLWTEGTAKYLRLLIRLARNKGASIEALAKEYPGLRTLMNRIPRGAKNI
jgi:hypothetical protein